MRVIITTESRFERTPDGHYWTVGSASYEFWTRYLDVFDAVVVMGRVLNVAAKPPGSVRVDGANVSLAPLRHYLGPWDYLRRYRAVVNGVRRAIGPDDAVIVRSPGATTEMVVSLMRKRGRPFGMEVVGDPEEVFAPGGGVRTVLRPVLRYVMSRQLRRQCRAASAVAYVTTDSLQGRYPAVAATHVTNYSSITLPEDAFVRDPRPVSPARKPQRLVFVGSLEQMYKGPDVLIDALALACRGAGDLELHVLGDGQYRADIERRADARGIAGRVRFLGHLSTAQLIRQELDAADLFVLPSLTEGLPRALLEAMARGLPCVASDVGGIPELLAPPELVPRGNAAALGEKILEVLGDPDRCARLSRENLEKARAFHTDVLTPRRQAFYRAVRHATERWHGDLQSLPVGAH